VQEALTNVRRHAGAGATATVMIEYGQEALVVLIEDGGRAGRAGGDPGSGGRRDKRHA
jgi:signal transduction histidine kinase